MQENSEPIPSSPVLDLSDHNDTGIDFDISKRIIGESSNKETSNASSNGGLQ